MASTEIVRAVSQIIYGAQPEFERVSVDRSINFEREAGFAMQILEGNDYAMGIARSNASSVIAAVTNIAAIGISLNPAKKQAYLVPRKNRICLDISYMGLLDLAIASGSIMWGQAELVYQNDTFRLSGFDKPPVHERDPFATDRGEMIGVYVVVKTHAGDYLTTAMSAKDVNDIRDRSEAWKAWISKQKTCPWVTDPGEMAKKTVIKRASKLWPKTERLDQAVHYLNTDGDEGIQFADQGKPTCDPEVLSAWCAKAKSAKTRPDLETIWKEGLAIIRPTKDMRAYEQFKNVVAQRGQVIDNVQDVTPTEPAQREPGSDDDLEADFQQQLARENGGDDASH
ncbi:recombinase RecT [Burkholderia gladioli]|uniref:Recombinase RecT n=1 Tax=Burkholderia gladioli TaxID=28095 RepID=A0AB38TKW5_BURGA|nr:recombinase RecT [Burkholderia gladioli]UWX68861.1 recombinase RecT [Burkholderia gladioli]